MSKTMIALALGALTLAGCATTDAPPVHSVASALAVQAAPPENTDLRSLIYVGAQTLAERAGSLAKDRPIVVATMVSIDNLNESSTLGRLASQMIGNQLAQQGYTIKDVTYAKVLTVQPATGELILTRDATRISAAVNAQAVIAGTYAVGGDEVYLNLRLLKADDGTVLSATDVIVPIDTNVQRLVYDR